MLCGRARVQTVIVSDMHLTEAQPLDPQRPYWMSFKRREHFIDGDFARLLAQLQTESQEPVELILNGDIFDFDAVTALPDQPPVPITWFQRARGLASEAWMSAFKMDIIVRDHPDWFAALGGFVAAGHCAVFVCGNHDLEMHWPDVQQRVRTALALDDAANVRVRFVPWFYLSGGDTYVSHGHQYDAYCSVPDPVNPLIDVHGRPRVAIPFGDQANRFMLNGMGYFNPHATSNYIMSARQYVRFFFKYMAKDQPLLLWTWAWSAAATLLLTLRDYLRPPLRDPLTVEDKVAAIAQRSNVTPAMVRQLVAVDVPSACTNPIKIVRELWLDRGVLFAAMVAVAYLFGATASFWGNVTPLIMLVPLALLFPLFLAYSFQVKPETFVEPLLTPQRARVIARITGAHMAVFGHTHEPLIDDIGGLRYCNGGSWSPAFAEPECKTRLSVPTFVRVRPLPSGRRALELWRVVPLGPIEWIPDSVVRPLGSGRRSSHAVAVMPVQPPAE
ncbi:MAG: hypothetical protein EXR79_12760 [Myxococcales bacterium]|nr:hypothetical protein [Myxococcales bacterium]